jgi:hypothetical protein
MATRLAVLVEIYSTSELSAFGAALFGAMATQILILIAFLDQDGSTSDTNFNQPSDQFIALVIPVKVAGSNFGSCG